MKKQDQISRTFFLKKYGGLSLYDIDIEKWYKIDDEDIHFGNKHGYNLIGNPDHPDGTSTDHEYFIIHDDLFERILETNKNSDIVLKVISKDVSLPSIKNISTYSISKLRKRSEIISPRHQLQRKRHSHLYIYTKKKEKLRKLFIYKNPDTLQKSR